MDACVSALPAHERDRRYLAQLEKVATQRMRMNGSAARRWATKKFSERFGREPEMAVAS